jgi:hypothetical protein
MLKTRTSGLKIKYHEKKVKIESRNPNEKYLMNFFLNHSVLFFKKKK